MAITKKPVTVYTNSRDEELAKADPVFNQKYMAIRNAYNTATDGATRTKLHNDMETLRSGYGYSGGLYGNQISSITTPQPTQPTQTPQLSNVAQQPTFDIMGNIKALQKAKEDSIISGLSNSRDKALSGLQQEQSTIKPMYYDKRNQVASLNQMGRRTLAEELARRGEVGSGIADEGNIRANMSLQSQTGALDRQEAADIADIERRRSDVNTGYEFDVANARAGLEAASLEQTIAEMQRQRDIAREDERYNREWEYNIGRDNIEDVRYNQQYTDRQNQLVAEQQKEAEAAKIKTFIDTIGRYSNNYQARINQVRDDNDPSNDWELPYLEAAKANKVAGIEAAKSDAAQAAYKNAYDMWETMGIANADVARILGVPVGAKTADYNLEQTRNAISQQNANTAAKNAAKSEKKAEPKTDFKNYINRIDKDFYTEDKETGIRTFNDYGARKYILGLNLPNDADTEYLLKLYGLPIEFPYGQVGGRAIK
jgi:hypothetical protein